MLDITAIRCLQIAEELGHLGPCNFQKQIRVIVIFLGEDYFRKFVNLGRVSSVSVPSVKGGTS